MRSVLHLAMFWIFAWSCQAQDVMAPNINILKEVEKIQTMAEQLKVIQEELGELRRENKEQAKALEVLQANMKDMQVSTDEVQRNKVHKVAFSAFLLDSVIPTNVGPFGEFMTLPYKHVFTNTGGAYDPASGIFTAPLKGVYVFRVFSKSVGKPVQSVTAGLFKNGQHVFSTHAEQASGFYSSSNGATLQLEKGDTICVRLYPGAWIFDNGEHHHSSFSGHLLFPL